jgi:hypothetical protein
MEVASRSFKTCLMHCISTLSLRQLSRLERCFTSTSPEAGALRWVGEEQQFSFVDEDPRKRPSTKTVVAASE